VIGVELAADLPIEPERIRDPTDAPPWSSSTGATTTAPAATARWNAASGSATDRIMRMGPAGGRASGSSCTQSSAPSIESLATWILPPSSNRETSTAPKAAA
jgi:hypothetical protein